MREFRGIPLIKKPTVVCLIGSTRFCDMFEQEGLRATLDGKIVLTIGTTRTSDAQTFARNPEFSVTKAHLDALHLAKVALADEVLVLNVGGYIGESTARELAYARELGKIVRFLEPEVAR